MKVFPADTGWPVIDWSTPWFASLQSVAEPLYARIVGANRLSLG